jgi:hypothetical protein
VKSPGPAQPSGKNSDLLLLSSNTFPVKPAKRAKSRAGKIDLKKQAHTPKTFKN